MIGHNMYAIKLYQRYGQAMVVKTSIIKKDNAVNY